MLCMLSCFSHVQLVVILWTVASQALQSWDSPCKNTGVGCHALLQGIFLMHGSSLGLFMSPALAGGFFTTSAIREALWSMSNCKVCCLISKGFDIFLISFYHRFFSLIHFVLYDLNYYKCFKACFMTWDMVYLNVLLAPENLMYSTVVWSSINVYKIVLVKLFYFIVELFYIIDDFLSSYFI